MAQCGRQCHPEMGAPEGTHTATPRSSPGVRSDQEFEANPAVATTDQEAQGGEHEGRVEVWVPVPPLKIMQYSLQDRTG
eukprot:3134117-Pyramimonas_sp.AAC.1